MTTRNKFANSRQPNNNSNKNNNNSNSNNNNNNNKTQNDDDNCSVVCYKDFDDGHVGVVRIRQQPVCSACNLMRGTLSLYYKHVLENNHRENVKKLCDENRYVPSVFDKVIHLAFHNNFYYQSDKFHFRYKHTNEEPNTSSQYKQSSTAANTIDTGKTDNNSHEQKQGRKRRNLQVTLVFQDKIYTKIGTTTTSIREQLLNEVIIDRANDIAALPMDIYYIKKKIAPDNIHHNNQKSSVIFTMAKDQSQVMIKKQQQDQEPFENGGMSSAKTSSEDNGVEQTTAITTHELLKTEKIHVDEPPSFVDDIITVCKETLNDAAIDIYAKCGELKREQHFLSGIARRSFKKKNTFFCDICSIFLTSEKYCLKHLNGPEHLEKTRHYQTVFLPWRRAMQESLIVDKPLKDIMGVKAYDDYKKTMALYLAPNNLSNRGRFCCAYCEFIFTDQWSLEKHLHTIEHKNKQTPADHKDLVVRFANIVILPSVFKFNGITQLSEIPDDIKNRYQWRCATREQLNDETNAFVKNYPFDTCEGVTRIVNAKPARKSKSSAAKSSTKTPRNQHGKRIGFNQKRGAQLSTSNTQRGLTAKRSFPVSGLPNKRFRVDLNGSYPGANRGPGPIRHYETEHSNYSQSVPYNNRNDRWSANYSAGQQRSDSFERSNYELRSLASDGNGYYASRPPTQHMPRANTYDREQPPQFSSSSGSGSGGYTHQQANYDPNFIRAVAQAVAEYRPAQNPPPFAGSSNRTHQRSNPVPPNDFIHQVVNNLSRVQQQQPQPQPAGPLMSQVNYQNPGSLGPFGVNNNSNNINPSYFSSDGNRQQNTMVANTPPVRSYADYRASSGPASSVTPSSIYPPMNTIQNPVPSQPYPFDDYARSSNAYRRSEGPSFGNEQQHYGNFGQPSPMELPHQTTWRGSARGGNNTRGRDQGRSHGGNHFHSSNKPPGSIFSYSSSSNGNNKNTHTSMEGRGANYNVRSFNGRR